MAEKQTLVQNSEPAEDPPAERRDS
jgi:hypothetical protein